MASDIAVSARLQASGRLAHSRASRRPASQLHWQILSRSSKEMLLGRALVMILLPRISPGPRN
jgi:hypothetical protein